MTRLTETEEVSDQDDGRPQVQLKRGWLQGTALRRAPHGRTRWLLWADGID